MVNTFLTRPLNRNETPEIGFYYSARKLDDKRLPNQIREALWIYNTLTDLKTVVETLKLTPAPELLPETASYRAQAERFFARRTWFEATLTAYYDSDYGVVVKQGVATRIYGPDMVDLVSVPTRPPQSRIRDGVKYYRVESEKKQVKWIPRTQLYIMDQGERIISLRNHANHPINHMWHGYEDALGAYLNGHIRATRRRWPHRVSNIEPIPLPETYLVPWWVYSDDVVDAMNASLLRKQPSWYDTRVEVPKLFRTRGYIWTTGLVKEATVTPKTLAILLERTLAPLDQTVPELPESVFAQPTT